MRMENKTDSLVVWHFTLNIVNVDDGAEVTGEFIRFKYGLPSGRESGGSGKGVRDLRRVQDKRQ